MLVAFGTAPLAVAEPTAGAACSEGLTGAMTATPDGQTFLVCRAAAWQTVGEPFDPSDRWVSGDGSALTLRGQGRRNPEILSGRWVATPLDGVSACGAEQSAVTDAGVGAPQATAGVAGKTLTFEVVPVVYTIKLTGNCLWTRTG